jgi:ferrous iron transport protein A
MDDTRQADPVSLCDALAGRSWRVKGLCGSAALCQRLREMGFAEEVEVEKLAQHHLLLCRVCGSRLALDRETARGILVEPLGECA